MQRISCRSTYKGESEIDSVEFLARFGAVMETNATNDAEILAMKIGDLDLDSFDPASRLVLDYVLEKLNEFARDTGRNTSELEVMCLLFVMKRLIPKVEVNVNSHCLMAILRDRKWNADREAIIPKELPKESEL
jgi:hypothetical protein